MAREDRPGYEDISMKEGLPDKIMNILLWPVSILAYIMVILALLNIIMWLVNLLKGC